jgi:hypothetical protein
VSICGFGIGINKNGTVAGGMIAQKLNAKQRFSKANKAHIKLIY